MSAAESALSQRSPLASSVEADKGWSAPGLTLGEATGLCSVLITVRRNLEGELAAAALQHLGASLPPDLGVSVGREVAIVSCGRGRFLAVHHVDTVGLYFSALQQSLQRLAAVVDYSSQLTFLKMEGEAAPQVLSMLCSLDFDSSAFRAGTAVIVRMQDVRAHVWREGDEPAFTIGVPRSLALGCWESLLQCSRTLTSAAAL